MESSELKLIWSGASTEVCADCSREWQLQDIPVPSIYTVASIDAGEVPEPVCDYCIERKHPELFEQMLAERRRFMEG